MIEQTKTKVYYLDPEDQKKKITTEEAFNKKVAKATADKDPLPTIVAGPQTFGYKFPETVDEAVTLCGGVGEGLYEQTEVFISEINYALGLKQDNEANDVLQGDTFSATDGVFDISYCLPTPKSERVKMTDEQKAAKLVAKITGIQVSPEQLAAALALVKAQQAQSAGA